MNLTREERWLLLGSLGLSLWLCLTMPVFAQEAYYWTYAQHPDLSYFDHPPMVAWWIWLGTSLLGDGAIGVRLGTLLGGFGTGWVGLLWLRRLGCEPWIRCGWLVCTLAMPMLAVAHFLTTPDPPLLFAWTCCLYALWRARDGGLGWWALAGAAAGVGLLSKYAAAFLAPGGLLLLLFDPAMRRQWLRPGPWLGVLAAAVTFLPVIVWNVANDFESFRFQTEGRWQSAAFGLHWFLQFVGSQIGVIHPVIAVLVPAAAMWLLRRARGGDVTALWLLAFGLPMPVFFLLNSLFIQVKINWLLPCFLPLAAGVMWWWRGTERHLLWPRTTRVLTRIVIGTAVLLPMSAPVVHLMPQTSGSSWEGWPEIAQRAEYWEEQVDARDDVPRNVFFFASSYRDAAQLMRSLILHSRTAHDADGLEPVMAENVFGQRALQFDHWEPAAAHVGESAIYVLLRPDDRPREVQKLERHFRTVEKVERVRIERLGYCVAEADIFVATGYLGPTVDH
ncbi:MAG: glycosyltransferase family 39 protein [Planctomycetes bacterium]|nr:glycosyltransferase family 39 protein [Planctomycetota bacterium]